MHKSLLLTLILPALLAAAPTSQPASQPDKIKVLIITGGHGFVAAPFFKLFDDNPQLICTAAAQGKTAEAYNRTDLLTYDVILLYDFQRTLTDAQQATFLSLFRKGVGLICLHHALLSYQSWPEYERIVGGKYLLDNETTNGVLTPESTYQGNVDIPVKVTTPTHPVVAGLQDFILHDEIYRGVRTTSDINVLLTTDGHPLAWTRVEGNSRIVTTIVGHGPAYHDSNFQRLLAQAIRWAAKHS